MSTELVTVESVNPVELFKANGTDSLIAEIEARVSGELPDVSTASGRKEIASLAHKVAKSKTLLDGMGKDLADNLNAQLKPINAERKKVRDSLDALKAEIRQPLTDWESAEARRIMLHQEALEWIVAQSKLEGSGEELRAAMSVLEDVDVCEDWEEFENEAHREKANAITALGLLIKKQEKVEAEAAELEKLRKEKAEQEQRERDDEIRRQAEQAAKERAEQAAEKERREAAEALARVEREKHEAEEREAAAKLKAEQEKAEAEEREQAAKRQAELDKIEAERKAKERGEQAAKAERERIEREEQRKADEAKAREADKAHRSKINNQAAQAFMADGFSEAQSKQIVTLIAKGNVAHVKIEY